MGNHPLGRDRSFVSGEIAAAFCAGAISGEAAWTVAYFRGALAARLAATPESQDRGAMMAVGLSASALQPYFSQIATTHGERSLSVGCVNSADNITVTGLEKATDDLETQLDQEGVFSRKLKMPVAYHSSHMQAVAEEYKSLLQIISPSNDHHVQKGTRPLFLSFVTGRSTGIEDLCRPEYWVRNRLSTVRFSDAIEGLASAAGGALFNTLHDVAYEPNGDRAMATISLDEWRTKLPSRGVQPHVIHPTYLNA